MIYLTTYLLAIYTLVLCSSARIITVTMDIADEGETYSRLEDPLERYFALGELVEVRYPLLYAYFM